MRLFFEGVSRPEPTEVAECAAFSYDAILRAIRRGDLEAFEPAPGHYRIERAGCERWLRCPADRSPLPTEPPRTRARCRATVEPSHLGSFARLRADDVKG